MATDNLSFVRKEATKILYFDDGMIYEHGTPEEIYKNLEDQMNIFLNLVGDYFIKS